MIDIAIVDDSQMLCKYIKKCCLDYYAENQEDIFVDIFLNGTSLLNSNKQYDFIFLDIELGIDNGIDIAKRLRKKDKQVQIIIISGYEKYKFDAYSIHCFDYIDKPITYEKISSILKEIGEYNDYGTNNEILILKTLQGIKKIQIPSILYCEHKERKTFIYTSSQTYDLYMPLNELYSKLPMDNFGIPHRSIIVNYAKINLIKKDAIILDQCIEIPLSKSKKSAFVKLFKNFLIESR